MNNKSVMLTQLNVKPSQVATVINLLGENLHGPAKDKPGPHIQMIVGAFFTCVDIRPRGEALGP